MNQSNTVTTNPGGHQPYTWVTHKEMYQHTDEMRKEFESQFMSLWTEIRDIRAENQKRSEQMIWLLVSILVTLVLSLLINVPDVVRLWGM